MRGRKMNVERSPSTPSTSSPAGGERDEVKPPKTRERSKRNVGLRAASVRLDPSFLPSDEKYRSRDTVFGEKRAFGAGCGGSAEPRPLFPLLLQCEGVPPPLLLRRSRFRRGFPRASLRHSAARSARAHPTTRRARPRSTASQGSREAKARAEAVPTKTWGSREDAREGQLFFAAERASEKERAPVLATASTLPHCRGPQAPRCRLFEPSL